MSGSASWEPPIAYTGAITGYLVESALYCGYKALLDARKARRIGPGEARRLTRRMLRALDSAPNEGSWFARTILVGELNGYPLIVSPDAIHFVNGRPHSVIKSRIRASLKHYESDWASLLLASFILAAMYYSDRIVMTLVLAVNRDRLVEALSFIKREGVKPARGDGWRVITRIYDGEENLEVLRGALEVIVGEASPSYPPASRCKPCHHRSYCPWRSIDEGVQRV